MWLWFWIVIFGGNIVGVAHNLTVGDWWAFANLGGALLASVFIVLEVKS